MAGRSPRIPFLTLCVVAVLVAAFLVFGHDPEAGSRLGFSLAHPVPWRSLTYVLAHDGLGHLLFNVALLVLFGSFVEASASRRLWLGLWLGAGVIAAYGELVSSLLVGVTGRPVMVGASGAVSGLAGWAAVEGLRTPAPSHWIRFVRVAALAWLALQIVSAVAYARSGDAFSVAHWAHAWGFLVGSAVAALAGGTSSRILETAHRLIEAGRAAQAVDLLARLGRDSGRPPALRLLAEAWESLGDREQAAEYWLRLSETQPSDDALREVVRLSAAHRISPETRLAASVSTALDRGTRVALLSAFSGEPPDTPGRDVALLRLADLLKDTDSGRAREILGTVIADYHGSQAADMAASRLRSLSDPPSV